MIEIMMILTLLLIAFTSIFFKPKKHPIFLYTSWWCFWLSVSYVNVMNFYQVSYNTYLMMGISIFAMTISYAIFSLFNIKLFKLGGFRNSKKMDMMLNVFNVTFLIVTIFLLIKMMILTDFQINHYWKARFYYYNLEIPGVQEQVSLFQSSIHAGVYHIMTSGLIFSFIFSLGLNNKKLMYFTLFNVVMWCVLTTGRDVLFFMIIYIIHSYKSRALFDNKKTIIGLIAVIILISLYRGSGLESVFFAFLSYFTGSIVFFDQLLIQSPTFDFEYGGIIFSQIAPIFYHIANLFNNENVTRPFIELGAQLTQSIRISDGSYFYDYYNALPTWFYFFYKDFGFIGMLLYSSIIGFSLALLYSMLKNTNSSHNAVMAFIEASLLWSIFKPQLLDPQNLIMIFGFILIMVNNNEKSSNLNLGI